MSDHVAYALGNQREGFRVKSGTSLVNTLEDDVRAAAILKRAELLRLNEPSGLSLIPLQIHRNYSFELIGSVLPQFLWLSGLKPVIAYGDYDDTLTFAQIDSPAIQIVSLDFERYGDQAGSASFDDWFRSRLEYLRGETNVPVVVSNWPSDERRADEFNRNLEDFATGQPGIFVWDTAQIFRSMRENFFDERAASARGTRLSNAACLEMARSLGLVRLPSTLLPRIKAIAVDLDDTLYEGVLGEDGVEGIRIHAQYREIYGELLRLRIEGVFLAVLSKNDERDFLRLCQDRSDFGLKPEHFSACSFGWQPKPERLAQIAGQLRIGTDSILVIDDNPGELSQMRGAYSNAPLLYSGRPDQTLFWLRHYPRLNGYRINSEAILRVADLDASRQRVQFRSSVSSTDYLREMQIEIVYRLNAGNTSKRLAELSQKTNQFNTGLRRFSELEVARRLKQPGHFTISISLRDRFGDSGIVGAIFARMDDDRLVIDEICVSCRALGRNVENPMIALALAPIIQGQSLRNVGFWFSEGPRNLPARNWLTGFSGVPDISAEDVTAIDWAGIPHLNEHLQAPIATKWEPTIR